MTRGPRRGRARSDAARDAAPACAGVAPSPAGRAARAVSLAAFDEDDD